jgi:hypothetical protein
VTSNEDSHNVLDKSQLFYTRFCFLQKEKYERVNKKKIHRNISPRYDSPCIHPRSRVFGTEGCQPSPCYGIPPNPNSEPREQRWAIYLSRNDEHIVNEVTPAGLLPKREGPNRVRRLLTVVEAPHWKVVEWDQLTTPLPHVEVIFGSHPTLRLAEGILTDLSPLSANLIRGGPRSVRPLDCLTSVVPYTIAVSTSV